MSNTKRYRLLKDIDSPLLKAKKGEVGVLKQNNKVWFDDSRYFYLYEQVEKMNDWFEPVTDTRPEKKMERKVVLHCVKNIIDSVEVDGELFLSPEKLIGKWSDEDMISFARQITAYEDKAHWERELKYFKQFRSTQPQREKLFTTEDGVDLFDGDMYWRIVSDGTAQMETAIEQGRLQYPLQQIKRFSTKEAAEEYVKSKSTQPVEEPKAEANKDWEIFEVVSDDGSHICYPNKEIVDLCIKHNGDRIHSVRRLSDGEVWAVNELAVTNNGRGVHKINGFKIIDGDMCVDLDGFTVQHEFLSKIKKPSPTPSERIEIKLANNEPLPNKAIYYTKEQYLEGIEKAFEAARERTPPGDWQWVEIPEMKTKYWDSRQYPTFTDYKKTLSI